MTGFFLAAAAMLVAALSLILVPLLRRSTPAGDTPARATASGVIAAIVLPIAAIALYLVNTTYPWQARDTAAATAAPQPPSLEAAIAQIEARLATSPDDATGWRMLGRARVMAGQFPQAVSAYEKSMTLTGGLDFGLRLDLAEALVLANEPPAQEHARQIIDEVLGTEPANQKALWYSGVIALRTDDPETAKQRFRALLAQDPPGEIRGILETQIAALDAATGTGGGGTAAPAAQGRTIRVTVTVGDEVAARVKPGVPVFVSARQPGIPGPPLAAMRLTTDALPATVELSDANAMIEGRNLSSVDEIEVTARVAFGGTAMTAPGDLVGSARSRRTADERVAITIGTEIR